ncbi:hypothetical protein P8452_22029 [Trifolium repens]|nr:hypothetical protein P8452_22029 [Trifolium repens]
MHVHLQKGNLNGNGLINMLKNLIIRIRQVRGAVNIVSISGVHPTILGLKVILGVSLNKEHASGIAGIVHRGINQ